MRIATAQQASSALIRIFLFGCSLSFCMLYSNLAAQSRINPHFEIFSADDNSVPDGVRAILQDQNGFIWIGTMDGLYRYDGYTFKSYRHDPDDPHTLSGNIISFLFEDSQGNLWIGTHMVLNEVVGTPGQLNRLDPATGKFERFNQDPDDPHNIGSDHVFTVFEDSDHMLWLGTMGDGLIRFDRSTGKFKRFMHAPDDPDSIGGDNVSGILEDKQGFLWVYYMHPPAFGVNRMDRAGEKFQRFPGGPDNAHNLSDDRVLTHLEDSQGKLWFGTWGGGLNRYDPLTNTFERWVHAPDDPTSLSDYGIRVIYEDTQQDIWIGTWGNWGGLNRFDRTTGKFQRFTHDPGNSGSLCANMINDILEDPAGNLWIATEGAWDATGGGLALMNPADGAFECFYSGSNITLLMKDAAGNLWFNPAGQLGRMDLTSRKFRPTYPQGPVNPTGPVGNGVGPIMEDSDGYIWTASEKPPYVLNRLDRNSGEILHFQHDPNNLQETIIPKPIISLYEDMEGYLWVGYLYWILDQVDRTTGKVVKRFRMNRRDSTAFHVGPAMSILEDRAGNLWFGGGGGRGGGRLDKFNKTTGLFQQFQPCYRGPTGPAFFKVILDSQGYFWMGTADGLCRLDPATGQTTEFSHDPDDPNSLSHSHANTLFEDSQQNIWVGTLAGLNRWNRATGKFTRYYERDGLPHAYIWGILEDDRGRLWLSTANGLSCFDPETGTFHNFDGQDGLQMHSGFSSAVNFFSIINSCFKSPRSGELFFGGPEGLTIFHPDSIRIDSLQPKIAIASFSYYDRKKDSLVVDDFIAAKEKIILSHKDNMLSFEFAALHFRNSNKTQYKYQLNGFNGQWYELGNKREVTFTDLRPGNYTLRVMAANDDGIWNPEPTELAITVTPPWWWSWWTKLVYLSLLMGALYGLYRLLLHRKLTLVEAKQLKALDALKSKFYTNITHEFRTPLTVIQGMSDQLIEKAGELPKDKIEDNARIVKRNSAQLLTMVNQMLDLRRLESGSLPVNLVKGDVLQYLRYLTESFYSYASDRGVGLHFMTDLDELVIDYDEDKLLHIVSNLLSNAIKFTPEGGNVYFSVDAPRDTESPKVLELRVKDTGIGISEEQLPFIFDRFYQADQHTTRKGEGTGIGLALTRELVRLMEGTIEVKSKKEQGSTFFVQLPISREAAEAPADQLSLGDKMLGFTAPRPFVSGLAKNGAQGEDVPMALVIEDNPDVVRYLSACLEGDYKVVTALDGQTGVNIALDTIPDIIVSDVMMPEKDGYEVCEILKNDERTSHIPIILLTAKADKASKIKGLRTGADAYLAKPFNREELDVRLEQLIEIRKKIQERYCNLQSPVEKDLRTFEDTFLDKVKKVILENISDPEFNLPRICRALGMSRSQLFRKLKALTGKSTTMVVRSIRLEQARQLLQNTDLNVSEVAYEVGFKDRAFFSRLFTEEYGEPPSSLRT